MDTPARCSRPLISYVIVTRNRCAAVCDCLASVCRQSYGPREIVVVANGSDDDTVTVIRERFPAVRLLILAENHGAAGGRNAGIQVARGHICILLDDDAVLVEPTAAERVIAYFDQHETLAVVAFDIYDAAGQPDPKAIPRADKRRLSGDYPCAYFCAAGFALRREAFRTAGLFWEPLFYLAEELDLSYRLLDRGYSLIHSNDIRVLHREIPASRRQCQWVYYQCRNRPWVAVRNLPWPLALSTTLLWWVWTGLAGIKQGCLGVYLRAVTDSLRGIPAAWRERRCIGPEARRVLKALSGRRWY